MNIQRWFKRSCFSAISSLTHLQTQVSLIICICNLLFLLFALYCFHYLYFIINWFYQILLQQLAIKCDDCASDRRDKVYLIKHHLHDIKGTKLPSNKRIFSPIFLLAARWNSCSQLSYYWEGWELWNREKIPVKDEDSIASKKVEEAMFAERKGLAESSSRWTKTRVRKEDGSHECFPYLLDIAHAETLPMIKIYKDESFLVTRREKEQRGSVISVDKNWQRKGGETQRGAGGKGKKSKNWKTSSHSGA